MRVLLIDDDPMINKTVERILRKKNIQTDSCTTADDALLLAESGMYDFILLDYLMPRHTGEWFLKNVTLPQWTKVILHTSYVNNMILNRMFKLGISGYMQKPVASEELLRHLNYHAPAAEAPVNAA